MMQGNHTLAAPIYDALIVGAGPAGSALATWLAGEGWRTLLVERDHLPRHKVCGEFLSPEAQTTLGALGLAPAVLARDPVLLNGATLTTVTGRTVTLKLPGTAWGISRYALDNALADAAMHRGAEVWTGVTVTRWQATPTGMIVQLRPRDHNAPTAVAARAVVLACGRQGAATLLPNRESSPRHTSGRQAGVGIKCHYADLAMPSHTELFLFPGGYVGMNPVENHHVNVCALSSYDAFACGGRAPQALIEAAAQWNPAFGARLRGAEALPETACAVAPVATQRAGMPWRELPLLGDTAVMIPPLVGDGMAMALRSAELCGPLLDGYLRGDYIWHEFGRRYLRLWHREFDPRLRVARLLENILLAPRMANLLVGAGTRMPWLANYLVQATRGTNH
jgi:menaquinone-9 beta-reductase